MLVDVLNALVFLTSSNKLVKIGLIDKYAFISLSLSAKNLVSVLFDISLDLVISRYFQNELVSALMSNVLVAQIIQGVMAQVSTSVGSIVTGDVTLPDQIIMKIEACGFFESIPLWLVSLIGALLIAVLSCVMLLTVYSRFFKLYMYTAIAPVPMSSFAGEGTAQVGRTFLKSYAGVCLQGAIIILACIIYSVFAESAPIVDEGASAVSAVWSYLLELIVNLLVLVGAIRMSDRIIHEMIGM